MANSKLGKGLDILIPKEIDAELLEEDKNRVQKLLISDIAPNPDQPRRDIDETALTELTTSVKHYGVLQPIIVVRAGSGYRIVAGERRWRAAKAAMLNHMPAIVRSLKELEEIELALVENIQRVDLSPLEQGLSVYKLQHQFNMTLDQVAERLGKAPSTVSNLTRLLNLPDDAREALRTGKISEGHARAILALKALPAKQGELLSCILNNGWNVRQAEQFTLKVKKGAASAVQKTNAADTANDVNVTKMLSTQLGVKVKIMRKNDAGQLIIPFSSSEQLQKIINKIK